MPARSVESESPACHATPLYVVSKGYRWADPKASRTDCPTHGRHSKQVSLKAQCAPSHLRRFRKHPATETGVNESEAIRKPFTFRESLEYSKG
jgi:hypothetical protein